MEKGKVKSVADSNGGGAIADSEGRVINFNSSAFVGRGKGSLKTGDMVWFERVGSNLSAQAINIRTC